MMNNIVRIGLVLAVTVSACSWGSRPDNFEPALGPQGAHVAVRVTGESADRVGELYAVDSLGVMLRTSALVRVRWSRLSAMDVDKMSGTYDISFGEMVSAEKRERLALVSRFPQGLQGALLARVLSMISQSELVDIQ